jgi:DNA-binding transcriptional LysR family regulator
VADQVDVVVRVNPAPNSDLVGRCFLRNRQMIVAPRGLLRPAMSTHADRRGRFPAAMRRGTDDDKPWHVVDETSGQEAQFNPKAVLCLASPLSIPDALIAGAGAAMGSRSIAIDALVSGRLSSWGLSTGPTSEIRVLHASHRPFSPSVSAFVNFVGDDFSNAGPRDMQTLG